MKLLLVLVIICSAVYTEALFGWGSKKKNKQTSVSDGWGPKSGGSGNQRVCAEGRLFCSSKPERANNIKIKMMDKNSFRRDTKMAESKTDGQGRYHICGESSDPLGNIDPELRIFTQCNSHSFTCARELRKPIDDKFIGGTYKMDLDLDIKLDSSYESHDCFH